MYLFYMIKFALSCFELYESGRKAIQENVIFQGRVLYDVLIYSKATGEAKDLSFLVECDRSIIPDIMKHFKMYKLRKKVSCTKFDFYISMFMI